MSSVKEKEKQKELWSKDSFLLLALYSSFINRRSVLRLALDGGGGGACER